VTHNENKSTVKIYSEMPKMRFHIRHNIRQSLRLLWMPLLCTMRNG